MEKMPYHPALDAPQPLPSTAAALADIDWRRGAPTLANAMVTVRELRTSDAAPLFAALSTEQVSRFISPPPPNVRAFEQFIAWTHRQREAGQYVCFAVVPRGSDVAVGLFQIRALEPSFATAEWGFAIAVEFWGSGIFVDAARAVIDFAFSMVGVHRLEARAVVQNGRGNGALRKLGAVPEGVLRRSFLKNGEYLDQRLWTLLREEWRHAKAVWSRSIH
jgi:ribosomal-protein-alanine N-acetyltransferase